MDWHISPMFLRPEDTLTQVKTTYVYDGAGRLAKETIAQGTTKSNDVTDLGLAQQAKNYEC